MSYAIWAIVIFLVMAYYFIRFIGFVWSMEETGNPFVRLVQFIVGEIRWAINLVKKIPALGHLLKITAPKAMKIVVAIRGFGKKAAPIASTVLFQFGKKLAAILPKKTEEVTFDIPKTPKSRLLKRDGNKQPFVPVHVEERVADVSAAIIAHPEVGTESNSEILEEEIRLNMAKVTDLISQKKATALKNAEAQPGYRVFDSETTVVSRQPMYLTIAPTFSETEIPRDEDVIIHLADILGTHPDLNEEYGREFERLVRTYLLCEVPGEKSEIEQMLDDQLPATPANADADTAIDFGTEAAGVTEAITLEATEIETTEDELAIRNLIAEVDRENQTSPIPAVKKQATQRRIYSQPITQKSMEDSMKLMETLKKILGLNFGKFAKDPEIIDKQRKLIMSEMDIMIAENLQTARKTELETAGIAEQVSDVCARVVDKVGQNLSKEVFVVAKRQKMFAKANAGSLEFHSEESSPARAQITNAEDAETVDQSPAQPAAQTPKPAPAQAPAPAPKPSPAPAAAHAKPLPSMQKKAPAPQPAAKQPQPAARSQVSSMEAKEAARVA